MGWLTIQQIFRGALINSGSWWHQGEVERTLRLRSKRSSWGSRASKNGRISISLLEVGVGLAELCRGSASEKSKD